MDDRHRIEKAAEIIAGSPLPVDVLQAIATIKLILADRRASIDEVILAGYDQIAPRPQRDPDAMARAIAIQAARRSAAADKVRIPEGHFHATSELVHHKTLQNGSAMVTVVLRFPQDGKLKALACNAFESMAGVIKALTETTDSDTTFKVAVAPPRIGTNQPPTVRSFEIAKAGP